MAGGRHVDLGIPGLEGGTRIGEGGNAVVFRARQPELDRDVAVKILKNIDADSRRRLDRERRAMGRLSQHDGIVTIYESGYTAHDEPYLVMPLMEGSLADELRRRGRIPWSEAVEMMIPVCDAVAFGHDQGVVHRDLKPSNLMLTSTGRVLVADFGISQITDASVSVKSTAISLTPAYSPPEAFDSPLAAPTADVYSLGATLYALLAGHPPFASEGEASSLLALLNRIVSDPVEPLPSTVPDRISAAVMRSLSKDPAERQPNASELAAELRAALDGSPYDPGAAADPTPVPGQAGSGPPPASADFGADDGVPEASIPRTEDGGEGLVEPTPRSGGTRLASRRRMRVGAAIGLGLVGALAIVVVLLTRGDPVSEDLSDVESSVSRANLPATGETAPNTPSTDQPSDAEESGDDQDTEEPTDDVTGIDALARRWEDRRSSLIASLTQAVNAGQVGIDANDDRVLRLPGVMVDLADCPSDWDPAAGVTSDSIRIGGVAPSSGEFADVGEIATGMRTYFEFVNESAGGVDGKRLDYVVEDDGYDPFRTGGAVEALGPQSVFAVHTMGTPHSLAVRDMLNDLCVPQPLVASGHPAFGDPANHPWTIGGQMSYATEARVWGSWIEQQLAGQLPVSVVAVVKDSPVGLAYRRAFEDYASEHAQVVGTLEWITEPEPTDAAANAAVAALVAGSPETSPDVLLAITSGAGCLNTPRQVARTVSGEMTTFLTSGCTDYSDYFLEEYAAFDGWLVVRQGVLDISDQDVFDDEFVTWVRSQLEMRDLDPEEPRFGAGFYFGWTMTEALRIAAELPGGLTRPNFMLALWSLDLENPMLPSQQYATAGVGDAYLVETARVDRFLGDAGDWQPASELIDLAGQTPACSWDPDSGC